MVVLPTPLTPTNIHTFGLPGSPSTNASERSDDLESGGHLGLETVEQLLWFGDLLRGDPVTQSVEQLLRHPDSDIGAQQRLFEVVERLVVDRTAPEDSGERSTEGRAGLGEPIAQRDRADLDDRLVARRLDEFRFGRLGLDASCRRPRPCRVGPRRRNRRTSGPGGSGVASGVATADDDHADAEHHDQHGQDQEQKFDTHWRATLPPARTGRSWTDQRALSWSSCRPTPAR